MTNYTKESEELAIKTGDVVFRIRKKKNNKNFTKSFQNLRKKQRKQS